MLISVLPRKNLLYSVGLNKAPQKSKVRQGTDMLNRASESIARSTRVAVETGKLSNTQN